MSDQIFEKLKNFLEYRDYNDFFIRENFNDMSKKCSKISSKIRQEANEIFRNHSHDEHSHKEILSHYSRSIAFAPNASEELAMAYSNRSALLLHLKKYEECLIDIERAHPITNSDKLRIKLLDRKRKCLSFIDASLKTGKNIQPDESLEIQNINNMKLDLKFVPSKRIPCATESISLRYNEEYGRHMIATKDIKPGEIVIVEEKCVFVSMPDKKYLICTNCIRTAWNGLPCDCCAMVIFCSEKCKAEAWQQYHDVESSILNYLYSLDDGSAENSSAIVSYISAVRLFIKAVKEEGLENIINDIKCLNSNSDMHLKCFFHEGVFQSNKLRSIYNLFCPSENECAEDVTISSKIIDLLCRTDLFNNKSNDLTYADKNMISLLRNSLIKLKEIVNLNSWEVDDARFDPTNSDHNEVRGLTMTLFCSLVNHSCHPNVKKVITNSAKFVVFALRPIAKGTQIYDSYGPVLSTSKCIRQDFLRENFFFTCKCIACTENWPGLDTSSLRSTNSPKIEIVKYTVNKFYADLQKKMLSNFSYNMNEWPHDDETVKGALTLIELIYKYYDGHRAFMLAIPYVSFIEYVFLKLFGLTKEHRFS